MDNQFNTQEWTLPMSSTMKELEKPVSPAAIASFHHQPTEDPEVQEVDRSQVSNNKGKKKVAQRGKSFSKEEDRALCSAFLHVSTDAIIGTNQTAAGYYARMHQHFKENVEVSCKRTQVSIENRWTTIQKAVNKFCGFYAAIERRNESGKNEQDRINDAVRMYEETEPWQFHHCWVILRGEPKWHEKMVECNSGQKVNRKQSEIEINSLQTDSTFPERPEGRDSAKKKARVMADTSSSSTAVEMLQKMHERGEKNDEKEDELRQEMFQMERERLDLQKLNWEKKWAAWEKKWAVMESNAKLRQNEYELNQWNADLIVMSQDLDKLAPPLRAMYEQKQMEIMKRRGINTPPTSES
ncbi:hypothetical protein PAHAL_2G383400 [Panicum hallii]|uniref:No apical meristem-associated C-terminal domain-containing protein n=1 Tax=Panicum hallii TaxID=206008 RepID=A0A2T8KRW6_9POAL|nr:hypothetical protein PAHAL_2G383400 [Panicum hallii]